MIGEDEARSRILDAVRPLAAKSVPLGAALGRFSAEELRATVAMPGFDNSAMDGYAVIAAEAVRGARLKVTGEQAAGRDARLEVAAGCCVRIFTGAPLPRGADAVVMQEDVDRDGDEIFVREPAEAGEFVRRRGSDLCEGQMILREGERISPGKIGLLASQGMVEVKTGGAPRIAVVTTGNELVPAGRDLNDGEIYNSNGPMLAALVREVAGAGANVSNFHAGDTEAELRAVLEQALNESDMVIISGGVSVGDHDLVKPVLESLGVDSGFWRVRVKPGKPLLFGQHPNGACVFGLPGNPVSSFVTFQLFTRPAILRMMGASGRELTLPEVECRLAASVKNRGDRPHYIRGVYDAGRMEFIPSAVQQSHALFGLSQSNALVRLEPEETADPGARVRALMVCRS